VQPGGGSIAREVLLDMPSECVWCACAGDAVHFEDTLQELIMAANTKSTPSTEMPDLAEKLREQLVTSVQQGQQLYVDAAQSWVKVVSVLPVPDLPKIPGVPALPDMEAATKYTFGLAADLLNAQREFALQLANVLSPQKSA
jgi:hypothetical protein